MNLHALKTWPDPFQAILNGEKRHEVRKDDRTFVVGDVLILAEYLPDEDRFTGRSLVRVVTYKSAPGTWGLPADLCVLSLGDPGERFPAAPRGKEGP